MADRLPEELSGSDVAVSITGIAGPDGGSEEETCRFIYYGIYH
jgi:nicotinamide mononucleotide (NMN) deamidase PncC